MARDNEKNMKHHAGEVCTAGPCKAWQLLKRSSHLSETKVF